MTLRSLQLKGKSAAEGFALLNPELNQTFLKVQDLIHQRPVDFEEEIAGKIEPISQLCYEFGESLRGTTDAEESQALRRFSSLLDAGLGEIETQERLADLVEAWKKISPGFVPDPAIRLAA